MAPKSATIDHVLLTVQLSLNIITASHSLPVISMLAFGLIEGVKGKKKRDVVEIVKPS